MSNSPPSKDEITLILVADWCRGETEACRLSASHRDHYCTNCGKPHLANPPHENCPARKGYFVPRHHDDAPGERVICVACGQWTTILAGFELAPHTRPCRFVTPPSGPSDLTDLPF